MTFIFRFGVASMCFLAASAHADQIVLKNGDRITGEISRIWDEEITIEPAYADKFNVDVDAVEFIDARREFEIELADGRSVTAQLTGHDDDGNQLVEIEGETVAVPLSKLLELEEPEEYFDWESHVDFSSAINRGNTDSGNNQLRADTSLKLGNHRHIADVTFTREEQDGETTKERDLLRYHYNWIFRDPWFLGGNFSFERDPIRELDHRYIVGATLGRDIWNRPRRSLSVQAGLGYQTEDIGGDSENNGVALWILRFRQDFIGNDLETFHNHSIVTNVSGRSNTVINTETGVNYEISDLLYAKLSLNYDYETEPADDAENEDLSMVVGVGLEF